MTDTTNQAGLLSRARAQALVLTVATATLLYLCYRIAEPFLPALAWSLALAVIAAPLHRRLSSRIKYPSVAAGLSTAVVVIVVLVPVLFVTQHLVREGARSAQRLQSQLTSGELRQRLNRSPTAARILNWITTLEQGAAPESQSAAADSQSAESLDTKRDAPQRQLQVRDVAPALNQAAQQLTGGVTSVVGGTVWIGMQLLITLMALFYFLRDRQAALAGVRSLLPLSHAEADEMFDRVDDTIRATVFGALLVALVQGSMGGLMFWWLGLPAPLVWGAVMALLAMIPVLGTFVVWIPAAIMFALQGEWTKALVLAAWGAIAIGLIDNLLYPFIVGKRIRFHTLIVFIAIVGGLALFGASGVVLGPLTIAIVDALLDVWRRRTAGGAVVGATPAT